MTKQKQDLTWAYVVAALVIGAAGWYFLTSYNNGYVNIKYRDDKVNVSAENFESIKASDSTVRGAWYDSSNEYMVIKLGGTYYHYCGMSSRTWSRFKAANSLYAYYQDEIKGKFDCRVNPVPEYE